MPAIGPIDPKKCFDITCSRICSDKNTAKVPWIVKGDFRERTKERDESEHIVLREDGE